MEYKLFSKINLGDEFFNSLRESYTEFDNWFRRKAGEGESAFVLYDENGMLDAFLYLKIENEEVTDVTPHLPKGVKVKVGTLKVNAHGTRLGERFVKKIFDFAVANDAELAYVTVFNEHDQLINLLLRYGFEKYGTKETANGTEQVLVKNMSLVRRDLLLDYPLIRTNEKGKFGLAIYPEFHSKLFPDSLLNNESYEIIPDVSATNSIHKMYICFMDISALRAGDVILIYRTSDGLGPARFRSVITSICVVEEIKTRANFANENEYVSYCRRHSIFNEADLRKWYRKPGNLSIIKMTYNAALRRKVTKGTLTDEIGLNPDYWGFFRVNDEQFNQIISRGKVYENIIVDQT
jgi:hypothetical protein